MTEEHKNKIRLSHLGKPSGALGKHWKVEDTSNYSKINGFKKGMVPWSKGRTMSKEFCEKISKSQMGRKQSEETKLKRSLSLMGLKRPYNSERLKKQIGDKNPAWKGGITPLRKKMYFSPEYKLWRKSVFERDNYTCQECGAVGCELNADHIKPWAFYPELRYDINNGRTLCVPCHRKTETWGNRKNIIRQLNLITS